MCGSNRVQCMCFVDWSDHDLFDRLHFLPFLLIILILQKVSSPSRTSVAQHLFYVFASQCIIQNQTFFQKSLIPVHILYLKKETFFQKSLVSERRKF